PRAPLDSLPAGLTASKRLVRETKRRYQRGNKHMKTVMNITHSALTLFGFVCFALSPTARALSPAPDGGYPHGNTAEGTNALFSLTSGTSNTGIGLAALFSLTTGSQNTAVGANALKNNRASQNTAVGFQAL